MKLTFLGTAMSKGIPIIGSTHEVCLSTDIRDKRLRSSVLISWDDAIYVIDCGPDFRAQMLQAKVMKLDGILYTHEHSDHTAGLDDIRPFTQRNGALSIYAQKRVLKDLRKRFSYIFKTKNKYPSAPSISEYKIKKKSIKLKGLDVIPIKVMHGELPILGYRFNKLAYLTDVSYISKKEKEKLKNLNVLVINALQIKSHPTHFNLEEALEFIIEIGAKRSYLTHIGPRLGFHANIEKQLPENVFLAYDGLEVII